MGAFLFVVLHGFEAPVLLKLSVRWFSACCFLFFSYHGVAWGFGHVLWFLWGVGCV